MMVRYKMVDPDPCPGCGGAMELLRYHGPVEGTHSFGYEAAILSCVKRCGVVIPAKLVREHE